MDMPRKAMSDVIVTIPGITGSVLKKDGRDVWNISGGALLNALRTLGDNIDDLKLERDSPTQQNLGDGVTAPSVIQDAHLIPGFWKIDGYTKLVQYIEKTFEVKRNANFFEFPYDWRRDNRVHAHRLAAQSERWLDAWKRSSGARDPKLIVVAHSMGGLIARYFLECLEGWKRTRVLVTFGTPFRGAPKSIDALANGVTKKVLVKSIDLSPLVRSFTSSYQLLPIYPCYAGKDGKLVRVAEATIPNVDQQKAKDALAFHNEIRDAVKRNQDDDRYVEGGYRIRPVVGILQPTTQSARLKAGKVELLRTIGNKDPEGDGTVPRPSATPLEIKKEADTMFSAEKHASLQNDDGVHVQLTGVLSGIDIDFDGFRTAFPTNGLALDVEDDYPAGEPIRVRVRPESKPDGDLTVRAENAKSGRVQGRAVLKSAGRGWYKAELGPFPEGLYRVTAFGEGLVDPVTDLVAVLGAPD
jgi:pimeloyl-ACP methyl ester carboxylesterase